MAKIVIVGGGTMGEALAKAFSTLKGIEVLVIEVSSERRLRLSEQGIQTKAEGKEETSNADAVILAVKPKDIKHVLEDLKPHLKGKLIVSIAAGVKLRYLESLLPEGRFIRAMPNITATVKAAVTTITPSVNVSGEEIGFVQRLFNSAGLTMLVEEDLLDVVTGLSGSGPAYIFLVIEALAEGGVKMGLPYSKALQLASWVAYGASKMVIEGGEDPDRLRRLVATPAGTTVEGLLRLEEAGVRAAFIKAVEAASKRAAEISIELSRL